MNVDPQARTIGPWKALQSNLTGSFNARTRGFLGDEFVLSGDGEHQGRLKITGLQGAEFTTGDLEVFVSRTANSRYTMLSGNENPREVLRARPFAASADELEIRCGERVYKATISLFRNGATAHDEAGDEAARLSGNVTGRAYKVETNIEDPCALPVAVLLIYHTALNRRRAYRTSREK